jgi:hypothetical protein
MTAESKHSDQVKKPASSTFIQQGHLVIAKMLGQETSAQA